MTALKAHEQVGSEDGEGGGHGPNVGKNGADGKERTLRKALSRSSSCCVNLVQIVTGSPKLHPLYIDSFCMPVCLCVCLCRNGRVAVPTQGDMAKATDRLHHQPVSAAHEAGDKSAECVLTGLNMVHSMLSKHAGMWAKECLPSLEALIDLIAKSTATTEFVRQQNAGGTSACEQCTILKAELAAIQKATLPQSNDLAPVARTYQQSRPASNATGDVRNMVAQPDRLYSLLSRQNILCTKSHRCPCSYVCHNADTCGKSAAV